MKSGLYVHVDDVKNVIDTFGSKSGKMCLIDEEYILSEVKERSEMYVTEKGNIIRRVKK